MSSDNAQPFGSAEFSVRNNNNSNGDTTISGDGRIVIPDPISAAQNAADRLRDEINNIPAANGSFSISVPGQEGPKSGSANLRGGGNFQIEGGYKNSDQKDQQSKEVDSNDPHERGSGGMTDCFPDFGDRMNKHVQVIQAEPTAEQVQKAKDKLDSNTDKDLSEKDTKTVKAMQNAVLDGNADAFSDAMTKRGNSDDMFGFRAHAKSTKDLCDSMNKAFQASDSGLNAYGDSHGRIILYGDHSKQAVQFDPKGNSEVKTVNRHPDGTITLSDETVLNRTPEKAMKRLANNAVMNMENPDGRFLKLDPSVETLDANLKLG